MPREFAPFPKLPLGLRNLVWRQAANSPRNVDIWSPTFGEMTLRSSCHDSIVIRPYRFISKQAPPGILHANQESRAIALEFFHRAFGNDFEEDGLALEFEPTIWCHPKDRICPMGPYTEAAQMTLFVCNTPHSWALNVFHKANAPSPTEGFSHVVEFPRGPTILQHKGHQG